ncbi:hypothetical protein [Burkholderia lata]|uniref:hypothetical protein n=1 Tax=Burkholderia lata (strain ATCC 17760 / DSM 23089 / LMG 22485 / NCIMB 9086 / R18194 / 383) TaxID=482957 RepID=UPI001583CBCC|nr:hypothetical protein [Burkholderia lata]
MTIHSGTTQGYLTTRAPGVAQPDIALRAARPTTTHAVVCVHLHVKANDAGQRTIRSHANIFIKTEKQIKNINSIALRLPGSVAVHQWRPVGLSSLAVDLSPIATQLLQQPQSHFQIGELPRIRFAVGQFVRVDERYRATSRQDALCEQGAFVRRAILSAPSAFCGTRRCGGMRKRIP